MYVCNDSSARPTYLDTNCVHLDVAQIWVVLRLSPSAALSPEVPASPPGPGGGPVQGQRRGGGGGRGPGGRGANWQRVGGLVIGVTLGGDHRLSSSLGLDWKQGELVAANYFCC